MDEAWRPVVGYETHYEVSSIGRVRRIRAGQGARLNQTLRAAIGKRGYPVVALCVDGQPHLFTVHRLVALAFIPNPEQRREVNHLNHTRADNRVENLEWATTKENQRHSWLGHRRTPTNVQLTADAVRAIRKLHGTLAQTQIARLFGVSVGAVRDIVHRHNWKHVA